MSLKKTTKEPHIKRKILRWYKINARKLPWRKKINKKLPNSYSIFVSEFMLQQTTVGSVIPRFNEFIKIWPTNEKLSKIKESTILKFWSGLGYYTRARNLLKSSKLIATQHNNIIPSQYRYLIQLPGVGDYTAKAILGIAFNRPVMPIDSNIERIFSRVYGIRKKINISELKINTLINKLISLKNSSNFIQALMDYGSIICIPNIPKCDECTIKIHCVAFKKNLTNKIPNKKIKKNLNTKKFTRAYIVENEFNEILIRKRIKKGMLQFMIEVPNDNWVKNKKDLVKDNLVKLFLENLIRLNKKIIYSFSHFNLEVEIYYIKVRKTKYENHQWLALKKIDKSGMPTIMKKIIKIYLNSI